MTRNRRSIAGRARVALALLGAVVCKDKLLGAPTTTLALAGRATTTIKFAAPGTKLTVGSDYCGIEGVRARTPDRT